MTEAGRGFSSRLVDIIAVLMLGITTVGTAWCGYQASQWNGQQTDLARQASNQQVEAGRLFGLATQKVSFDSTMIAQYAVAYRAGDQKLLDFYRTALVRPPFLPFLDKWTAEVKAGKQPTNIFQDQEYLSAQFGQYDAATAKAKQLDDESVQAGNIGDRYVVTTILLATALFFAGVTSSFVWPVARLLVLLLGVVAMGLAATRLVDLPVLW